MVIGNIFYSLFAAQRESNGIYYTGFLKRSARCRLKQMSRSTIMPHSYQGVNDETIQKVTVFSALVYLLHQDLLKRWIRSKRLLTCPNIIIYKPNNLRQTGPQNLVNISPLVYVCDNNGCQLSICLSNLNSFKSPTKRAWSHANFTIHFVLKIQIVQI